MIFLLFIMLFLLFLMNRKFIHCFLTICVLDIRHYFAEMSKCLPKVGSTYSAKNAYLQMIKKLRFQGIKKTLWSSHHKVNISSIYVMPSNYKDTVSVIMFWPINNLNAATKGMIFIPKNSCWSPKLFLPYIKTPFVSGDNCS